ncbi:AsmA family protein [Bacteroidales bacterium OttesenSCG-928-C19]|nr:AsmA family protein [Bacteroidales bacterium OttesenSCG-928-C19]
MKKVLKYTGIALLVILVLLITAPFLFKGKIMEVVKNELNKTMNAKIEFGDLGLNFFKSFPHASVSLEDICVVGVDEFEGDTLVYAKKLAATINIKSIFGDNGFEVTKVKLNDALLHAIILENEKANWDIMPESDEEEEMAEEETDTTSAFKLQLKSLVLENISLYYDDFAGNMNVALAGLNLQLSGDMTADETTIKTKFSINELSLLMDKIAYVSKASVNADMHINADLKNMKFTLADNSLQINEIKANIDGWLAMLENDAMEMDLKLNVPTLNFKHILSMIPAVYAKDFEAIKTSGEVTLDAWVKGTMVGENLPAFNLKLDIANAMFQYPDLPKAITNIQVNANVSNKGGAMDNTVVNVPRFHFEMGGSPFDIKLALSTPISDPNINFSAVGKLDLGIIKEIYPMDDMELNGVLNADLALATRLSYIEKEQFEKVEASGSLNIANMLVKMDDMDDVRIQNAALAFTPRYVDLSNLSVLIGKNDISANGKLENFIPFLLKDETIKGALTVKSNYLNLNDFMSGEETPETTTTEAETAISIIEIPKNIDFTLGANFKEVLFDNLEMKNVGGQIILRDGKIDMKNVGMNALGGSLTVNGSYDSGKNPKQPDLAMNVNIREVSFAQTFSTFVTVQKLAPIFSGMNGNFSMGLNLTSPLGADFSPILDQLDAKGTLTSNNVQLKDVEILNGLADALKNESLRTLSMKNLKIAFVVKDGRVTTQPFDVNFGGGNMNVSGSTGLDQSIDYLAKINLADKLSNKYIKNVDVKIGGTFSKPKFNIDEKALATQALDNLSTNVLGKDIEGVKKEATEKINAEIEKQVANIRAQAKAAGDKLVAESKTAGSKLIAEAEKTSNPIAKAAAVKTAKATAKKMEEDAQKQANKLNAEAEKQIQNILKK